MRCLHTCAKLGPWKAILLPRAAIFSLTLIRHIHARAIELKPYGSCAWLSIGYAEIRLDISTGTMKNDCNQIVMVFGDLLTRAKLS